MKQSLDALHDAIDRSTTSGETVPLDLEVDHTTLEALATELGCSITFVELPEGGSRIDGKGPSGEFTLRLVKG
ncbi:MAG: hypothetical protein P1V35_09690 [Planctomycetota bacterium]|nr:hypothetical protein [Planctomycetota bacterium]